MKKKSATLVRDYGPFVALTLLFFGVCLWANLDLTEHHAFLHTDEILTYEEVNGILHPKDVSDFLWRICDAGDHRYGRIYYNLSALAAWLPALAFGDPGQIIATRIFQMLLVWASYLLFVFTFLKEKWSRFTTLLFLFAIPSTSYYATMPKPEPTALFFLALFCFFYCKRSSPWGPHWIWLGLSFAAKIIVLPCAVLIAGFSWFRSYREKKKQIASSIVSSVGWFCFGWTLGIPMLFFVPFNFRYLNSYLNWTFRFTETRYDTPNFTALNWLGYIWNDWLGTFVVGKIAFVAWCVFVGFLLIHKTIALYQAKKIKAEEFNTAAILLCGVATTVLVILQVKRTWGFYLHIGLVLTAVGAMAAVPTKTPLLRRLALSLALLFFVGRVPDVYRAYETLATRTSSFVYIQSRREYELVNSLLKKIGKSDQEHLVLYDWLLFKPDSRDNIKIEFFWAQQPDWRLNPSLVVLDRNRDNNTDFKVGMKGFEAKIEGSRQVAAHTANGKNGKCAIPPCYRELTHSERDLRILVRDDLNFNF